MDVLVHRCAGLDVHRDTVVATVRVPGSGRLLRAQHTRTFATTTAGITGEPPAFRTPDPIRSGPEWRMIIAGTSP
jgi:hypothetical protein